ncbi:MAG: nucleoid-associated protein, partial [Chitinophagales bacterium]
MIDFAQVNFRNLLIHKVGNKLRSEGILLAQDTYDLGDEMLRSLLLEYFLGPFKSDQYYKFDHETALENNQLYQLCLNVFDNPMQNLLGQSHGMAEHLYEQSTHAKVKSGELYVCYFTDVLVEDELVNAIGIFKTENKDLYLKAKEESNQLTLNYEQGINIKKLDKGCIILNVYNEDGLRLMMIDKGSKSQPEAQYWRDEFLKVTRVHDNSFHTQNYLQLCQELVQDVLSEEGLGRQEQVNFLNKSLNFFKERETFDEEEFHESVLAEPERIKAFQEIKKDYE